MLLQVTTATIKLKPSQIQATVWKKLKYSLNTLLNDTINQHHNKREIEIMLSHIK